ncbi:MAG: iron-containing alcohol dehydrogenase [Dysgonamonadaceae bacterium]|jgi:glycerol dehydrogenase|nr:iron-containing alcohol dehydrogenase [Dysgonamonadaceae bacterium]
MLKIISPKEYVNQPDILIKAGDYIRKYGKRILLIGSEKSIESVKTQLFPSLEQADISYRLEYFKGYPTREKIRSYASVYGKTIDAVTGIGGGRVIDTAKALGNLLNVPVITVPTVAATCAAWAAVSILYDNEGHFVEILRNDFAPVSVLADTRILVNAPVRYTYAGVIDTFAKWYEINPYTEENVSDTHFQVIRSISRLAFRSLTENVHTALHEARKGIVARAAIQTVDAIVYLAGLAGSFHTARAYPGIAHTFYNLSTQVVPAPELLHGEKIAFGLLLQQVLLNENQTDIDGTVRLFAKYNSLFTLYRFGITDDDPLQKVSDIAQRMGEVLKLYPVLNIDGSKSNIEAAIYKTSKLIETRLNHPVLSGKQPYYVTD